MRHEHGRPFALRRVLGAVLTCLLAATVVVAAQRPHGHPHTIRAGAVAAVNADSGHAPNRVDHDVLPHRTPVFAIGRAPGTVPAEIASALYERAADSHRVRGPPPRPRG